MEINKLTPTNDRGSKLREADGNPSTKQSNQVDREIGQDISQTTPTDSADKVATQSSVQLSAAAQVLAEANDALANVSDVDLNRVQEIRSAIEQGTYHVDTQRLAANFADLETQLFG